MSSVKLRCKKQLLNHCTVSRLIIIIGHTATFNTHVVTSFIACFWKEHLIYFSSFNAFFVMFFCTTVLILVWSRAMLCLFSLWKQFLSSRIFCKYNINGQVVVYISAINLMNSRLLLGAALEMSNVVIELLSWGNQCNEAKALRRKVSFLFILLHSTKKNRSNV